MGKNVNTFEEFSEVNEKKSDKFKRGTKPPKNEKEITAEDIIDDFVKKTGLTKKEALKRLNKFAIKINKSKNKDEDTLKYKDEDRRTDIWEDEHE